MALALQLLNHGSKIKLPLLDNTFSSFVVNLHGRIDELIFVDLSAGNGLYFFLS
jgi:hypothetical protein